VPRPRQRACLEAGLKLDLNWLIRQRIVIPGFRFERARTISWTNSYDGEQIAIGEITFNLEETDRGWLCVRIGSLDQKVLLVARPRHFGGRQWYFVCPYMNRRVSVLWMPPGGMCFASRQRWGRQVGYASQFLDRDGRAHRGMAKINSRLCAIGGFDPDEWDLPPKPKWMRWSTYNRAQDKFERYEQLLDVGLAWRAAKLVGWS
jgi:hypothetical protein